ncbi:hypothetical protein NPIL_367761, partial [Nephila pilipes]
RKTHPGVLVQRSQMTQIPTPRGCPRSNRFRKRRGQPSGNEGSPPPSGVPRATLPLF